MDIPLLLKSIEEKKNNIAIIQNGLQQYESTITRIGNIQGLVNDLANNIQKETNAKELLTNYLKCYDSYISVLQIERELKNGPSEFFCPVDGEQQLNNLEIQAETFGNAIEQLRSNESNDGIDQINLSIAAIQINDNILSNEELIVTLNEQLEKYQITITENLNTQREINNLDEAIRENLNKINSAWTEETIKNFSDLISHKDAIQQFGTKFEQFKQDRISIVARQQAQREQSNDGNKNINYLFGILIPALLSIPAFLYSIPFGTTFLVIALLVLVVFLMSKKSTTPGNNSELADIDENIKKVTDDYRQYLQKQLNLEPNLSVTAVVEIFSLIDTSKQAIAKREEYHRIYEERNEYVKQFENLATDLKNKKLFQSASDSFEAFARDAKRQLAIEKQNQNTKARLTNILETKVIELKRQQQKLRDLKDKINGLFQDAGAPDRNGFLQKCRSEAKARELLEQKQINTNTIEKIIGFGKTDQLFSFFSEKDRTQVESEIKQLQAVIDDKKTAQLQLTNEKGGLETELKTLASASVLSELQTELEVDRNKLFDCYKQWLKHKIAFNVLNTIKRQYELEKQPDVVRYSSEVFSAITSAKYKRIHVPLDSREVLIYDQHERVKRIDQLSRGTKEQLLLSLPLGLIQEYEKNKEPLPIVLDDVFVNFDSCRTRNIAEAIQKFAENRQVIIFTCHSNLANNFPASVNKVNLLPYHIESEGISNELLSRDHTG